MIGHSGKEKIKMRCPICENKLEVDKHYLDQYILLEEFHKCNNCNYYAYEYVTGYIRETFGKFSFFTSYSKDASKFDALMRRVAILLYRVLVRKTKC